MAYIEESAGNPYPLGAHCTGDREVNIAMVCSSDEPAGVVLYDNSTRKSIRVAFSPENRVGNINCMRLTGLEPDRYEYSFYEGEREYCDPYGRLITGNEKWGRLPGKLRSRIVRDAGGSDIVKDLPIKRSYQDSIIYLLHVRGFTRHRSSGVRNPGTFGGITEKIPYLKELGITAVELMPAYEFIELEPVTPIYWTCLNTGYWNIMWTVSI